MSVAVRDFRNKKVVDYLNTGEYKRVLFVFHHGLGDSVMWQPVFEEIKRLYPELDIHQSLHCGQDKLFSSTYNNGSYDIVFYLGFPCNEYSKPWLTKAENCCEVEIGIKHPNTVVRINKVFQSPFIGTHYFSTSNPKSYGVPESVARRVHDRILDAGMIPLDTDMRHAWANSSNRKFSWNTCAIDATRADTAVLSGVIQRCAGFCGAASGNLLLATALLPVHKILYLKNKLPLATFTRLPILTIDINNYDSGVFDEWLYRVREND